MRRGRTTHHPKILIIGLDGATFDLMQPWIEAGKLPTFKRLCSEGAYGPLTSTIPPVTAPAWTSFMTGKNPGKHGLFHFIEPLPDSYELRYTNARSRGAKTIWQLLNEAGHSVGVVNVPMTYPPEPVHGYMISGLDVPQASPAMTYPHELYQELETQLGQVSPQIRYLGYLQSDKRFDALLRSLDSMSDHYHRMTQYLMRRSPVDVMMVVFTATDTVQHFFWQFMDPCHPQYDPSRAGRYGTAILKTYQKMDEIIAQLTTDLPDETTVILMSDHGAAPTSGRALSLHRHLADIGFLHLHEAARPWYRAQALRHAAIKKLDGIVKGSLPPQHKARLARLFPRLRATWESHAIGLSRIDWKRTKAYGYEVLTFPSGIWLNVKGQRPQGIVNPGTEYDQVRQDLIETLYTLQDPVTGQQLIPRIYRKEEIYHGRYLDRAPDLIPVWWEGVTFVGQSSGTPSGDGAAVRYTGMEPLAGGAWSGGHARTGMVIFRGRPFGAGQARRIQERLCFRRAAKEILPFVRECGLESYARLFVRSALRLGVHQPEG